MTLQFKDTGIAILDENCLLLLRSKAFPRQNDLILEGKVGLQYLKQQRGLIVQVLLLAELADRPETNRGDHHGLQEKQGESVAGVALAVQVLDQYMLAAEYLSHVPVDLAGQHQSLFFICGLGFAACRALGFALLGKFARGLGGDKEF